MIVSSDLTSDLKFHIYRTIWRNVFQIQILISQCNRQISMYIFIFQVMSPRSKETNTLMFNISLWSSVSVSRDPLQREGLEIGLHRGKQHLHLQTNEYKFCWMNDTGSCTTLILAEPFHSEKYQKNPFFHSSGCRKCNDAGKYYYIDHLNSVFIAILYSDWNIKPDNIILHVFFFCISTLFYNVRLKTETKWSKA